MSSASLAYAAAQGAVAAVLAELEKPGGPQLRSACFLLAAAVRGAASAPAAARPPAIDPTVVGGQTALTEAALRAVQLATQRATRLGVSEAASTLPAGRAPTSADSLPTADTAEGWSVTSEHRNPPECISAAPISRKRAAVSAAAARPPCANCCCSATCVNPPCRSRSAEQADICDAATPMAYE